MKLNAIRLLFISTVSATILAAPALAFDGQDLLNKINAAYKLQGIEIKAKEVVVDGSDVTLTEASLIYNDDAQSVIALGDISMEGVAPKDGGYLIESINFEDIDHSEDKSRFVASDIVMENVHIPALASTATIEGMMLYENASASDLEFYLDDSLVASIDNVLATMTLDNESGKLAGRIEVNEFSVDVSDLEDKSATETLAKLQMEIISGSFSAGGSWNTKIGDLDIEELKLSLDNMGTLSASFGVTGYTMQFVESLQEAAKEQATEGANAEDATMAGLGLLAAGEQLGIKSILIRFEDESITDRLIDFMASEQGIASTEFKTMLKAIVPMYVSQLGAPKLQQAIVKAVNIYLDDPQSISITARPKSPVLAPEILGTAIGNPADLPEILGVTVEANK